MSVISFMALKMINNPAANAFNVIFLTILIISMFVFAISYQDQRANDMQMSFKCDQYKNVPSMLVPVDCVNWLSNK